MFVGTACWIWFDIESTALRTLPTASLTLSVTELEVTEVARDKNEVRPPWPLLDLEAEVV